MQFDLKTVSRRITAVLFFGQSFVSGSIIVAATVVAIVASDLAGDPGKAGLPSAVNNLSSAFGAFIWGYVWERTGRRKGLALGLFLGSIGMLAAFFAVQAGSFSMFLLAFVGVGFGRAAMQLGRFIAADVNPPSHRGRAISYVVLGGTVGAIGGPALVAPSSRLALSLGFEELSGPFFAGAVLLFIMTLVVLAGMRPAPREVSAAIAAQYPEAERPGGGSIRSIKEIAAQIEVKVATVSMVISQMVMVIVMTIVSLYLRDHGQGLASISLVIMAHTLGMFAFSVFTGRLVDRWGRTTVILTGTLILFVAFALSPMPPPAALQPLLESTIRFVSSARVEASLLLNLSPLTFVVALGLFLVGLGWNFCFVGGSTLLADQLSPGERSRTQGVNDFLIASASAIGSYSSGVIYKAQGFASVNWITFGLVLLPFFLTIWMINRPRPA